MVVADVDAARIRLERMRTGTFNDAAGRRRPPRGPLPGDRRSSTPAAPATSPRRSCARGPLPVRARRPERLDEDCYEAFNIQVEGLVTRFRAIGPSTS
jgi:NAD+ synthase (glutamine-hydrolysing)